ncbi:hypothetical protein MSPP1_002073 [Malassezia sp. CBS 17886]|nr:hypothetical protein MSPP1_002073 [Malassezia sp. CBS 17886]
MPADAVRNPGAVGSGDAAADAQRARDSASTLPETRAGDGIVLGVAVVDFNHLVGPQVEYTCPPELRENEQLCAQLPFLALPDGSHLSEEDFCYFHVACASLCPATIFGISCNRQITSDELINKGAEVTRGTVQKAVVVLATQPIFGPLREKLGMVTRAFFAQRDLKNVALLEEFYATLEYGLRHVAPGSPADDAGALYMGTSLRHLVYLWRFKTLVLLKLILLQRKVMFSGYPVERLCALQYNLVSLIPDLLPHLDDAASPELATLSEGRTRAESLRMSDRPSLLAFMGMPLPLFGKNAVFQPCCPLQQMDLLGADSWVIGTTNSMFKQQRKYAIDAFVDVEQLQVQMTEPQLAAAVALTPADRRWMGELITVVQETWSNADPAQPVMMQYEGSDDYLRARFEEYVFGFLATAKAQALGAGARVAESAIQFGPEALSLFRAAPVFRQWHALTDETLCDLIGHAHPCQDKVSAVSDAALRLSEGLHDLRLDENLAPTREAIGAAFHAGSQGLSRVAHTWRSDLARITSSSSWGSPKGARSPVQSADISTEAAAPSPPATPPIEPPPQHGAPRKRDSAGAFTTLQATGAHGYAALGSFISSRQKAWTMRGRGDREQEAARTANSAPDYTDRVRNVWSSRNATVLRAT